MESKELKKVEKPRILSLDQFRGFAIFGMILVNYLGRFEVIHETFKHPRFGMTFANAIAPFFLFAVGMGFSFSIIKKIQQIGPKKSYLLAVKRYLVLIIIGIVLYGPDPVCDMWDALVDIGFAGLLTLPFILTSRWIRISLAFVFLIIYQLIFAYTGYGEWTMQHSIDGGPLGPISWASILFFGTVLMDDLMKTTPSTFMKRSLIMGFILTLLGLGLSYLQPESLWQFSQRSMTMAYPILASGLSFIVFVFFYWLNDLRKIELPHLTMLGMNPLIIYIVQAILMNFYGGFLSKKSELWQALTGFIVIYFLCYIVARYMAKNKIVIKI
jgi:predicted acyltransferase